MNKSQLPIIFEKYNHDDLFQSCIELSCPDGYIKTFDEIYLMVKSFNEKHNIKIIFGQVKMKFGRLTVYLDLPADGPYENIWDSPISINYDALLKKIETICSRTTKMCKICGKKTSTIVINTEVVERCFDHFDTRQSGIGK
jgi:hypothetical protein